MTSSNNNSRKVRKRTWISIALAMSTFVSLSYLFVEVSRQSAEFGEIKVNYEKYVSDLQDAKNQFKAEQLELAKLQATLSDVRTELGSVTAERANITMLKDQEQQKLREVENDLSATIEQIQIEKDKLRQLQSDQKSYDNVNVKLAEANVELSKINSEIDGRNQELEKLRKGVTSKKAAVTELERQISDQDSDFAEAKVLMVVLTCNHCPTAQAYEARLNKLLADYADKGLAMVAISPNDPLAVRLDELGYSDLGDSLDDMKVRAKQAGFNPLPWLENNNI